MGRNADVGWAFTTGLDFEPAVSYLAKRLGVQVGFEEEELAKLM